MAIRLKDGSIFLHIPKTGGSWVSEVLKELDLIDEYFIDKHANWDRVLYHEYFGPGKKAISAILDKKVKRVLGKKKKPDRPFVFCFVRHPLKWYESWWKYMQSKNWTNWGDQYDKENWHPNAILNGLGDQDFNTFVKNVIRKRPGYVSELFASYTQPGIGFIGRTENLSEDLILVLKKLNLNFDEAVVRDMSKVNASPKSKDAINWQIELRDIVSLFELPALIHYGYLEKNRKSEFEKVLEIKENPQMSSNQIQSNDL